MPHPEFSPTNVYLAPVLVAILHVSLFPGKKLAQAIYLKPFSYYFVSDAHMKKREQIFESQLPSSTVESRDQTQVLSVSSKCFYLMMHFADPA